jgi:hypothetical protein
MSLHQMVQTGIATGHNLYDGRDQCLKFVAKLDISLTFDAADPRDKVCVLMGLVSDAAQLMALVSYEATVAYSGV